MTPSDTSAGKHDGFLVEVTVPTLNHQVQQILFAVGSIDPDQAVAAVRKITAALHCTVQVRCGFSSRALAQLGVQPGGLAQLARLSPYPPAWPA